MVNKPRVPTGKGFPYGDPGLTSVFAMAQKKKTTKKSTSAKKPAVSAAPKATPKVEAPKPVSIPSTPPPAPVLTPKKKKNFLRRLLGF